jgi:hypothetical protein
MRNKEIQIANDRREMAKRIIKRMKNDLEHLKSFLGQLGHKNSTDSNYEKIIAAHIKLKIPKTQSSNPKK